MKLYIDTNDCSKIVIQRTDKEKESSALKMADEFVFGLATLATGLLKEIDAFTPEYYHTVRKLLVRLFDNKLENMIDAVLLDDDDEDDELKEVVETLRRMMEEEGDFSEEEIAEAIRIVRESGSLAAATEALLNYAEANGIDRSELLND